MTEPTSRHRRAFDAGYPVGHTAVIGWFSKAMKHRPQGMPMVLFASAGAVARECRGARRRVGRALQYESQLFDDIEASRFLPVRAVGGFGET